MFLGNPQSFEKPKPRADADTLRASDLPIYVHAPYRLNVCHPSPRIRVPSRKTLAQTVDAAAEIGAAGVIVHGGHAEDDPAEGPTRWWKVFEEREFPVPVLIENTAGGDNAVARYVEQLDRLWQRLAGFDVGFCFDTCHAHAAGEELADVVDRVLKVTGGSTSCTATTPGTSPARGQTATPTSRPGRWNRPSFWTWSALPRPLW